MPTWAALLYTVTVTGVQQAWQAQDVALGAVIIESTAGPDPRPQIHSVTTKTIVSYNYLMQSSHTKSSHTIIILTMISYHVFGMTYYLNSAPFLCLHRRHCQSQDIILHLPPLSVTPRTFHSKLKSHLFNHSYTLTLLMISPPHLNNTHPNSYSVPSWYSGNRT